MTPSPMATLLLLRGRRHAAALKDRAGGVRAGLARLARGGGAAVEVCRAGRAGGALQLPATGVGAGRAADARRGGVAVVVERALGARHALAGARRRVRPGRARQAAVNPAGQRKARPSWAGLTCVRRLRVSGGERWSAADNTVGAHASDVGGPRHTGSPYGRGALGLQAAPRPSGSACGPHRTGPPRRRCMPRPRRRRSSPCLASARSSLRRAESVAPVSVSGKPYWWPVE
jgi:hypothetical protein